MNCFFNNLKAHFIFRKNSFNIIHCVLIDNKLFVKYCTLHAQEFDSIPRIQTLFGNCN